MEIPIKINLPDQSDIDPLEQVLRDVSVTDVGVLPRPGYDVIYDTETEVRVDGIYDWREQDIVIIVSNGKVFKLDNTISSTDSFILLEDGFYLLLEDGSRMLLDAPAAVTEVTGAVDLVVGTRPTFANYGDYLFIANGGKIQMLAPEASFVTHGGHDWTCILNHTSAAASEPGVGGSTATYWTDEGVGTTGTVWALDTRYGSGMSDVLEDADAPILVSFIAISDTYLLALEDDTQRIWFSAVTAPWEWDSEWVSAEELPDDANCLTERDGDIWVGGERSIQSFVNDGNTPWVPSGYGAISHGVMAPYSFIFVPEINTFVWLDDTRRLVTLNGRSPSSLNHALNTWIRSVPNVTDAIGDYVVIGAVPYYILQFPGSRQAVWVNLLNGSFSELTAEGTTVWDIACITNVPGWDLIVAGHRTDGTVLTIDQSNSLDNAATVPSLVRTPRIQAIGVQRTPELILHFKKLVSASGSGDATIGVRWRDDGSDWKTTRTITLTDNNLTDAVKHLYRLGSYRYYRQYEFDLSGLHPYALIRVEQV